jgi:hypothetical protein
MRARAGEVAVWVLLALVLVAPSLRHEADLPGDGVDLFGTIWFFWWIRDCVEHLANPSWTPYFFFPYGKDVLAHTGNNFVDAVLSVPLQWVLGTPGYYKWWVVLVFLSNCAAFRLFVREEVPDRFAAAVATVLYAINPFMLYELQCGRPTQAMTAPLIASLLLVRRVDRSCRDAVFCGIAVAVTGWTYWFYAFFFAFACLWIVPATATDGRDRRRYALGIAVAAIVAIVLVLPAVIPMALRDVAGAIPGIEKAHGWLDLPASKQVPTQGYAPWEPEGARFLQSPVWAAVGLLWLILGPGRRPWLGAVAISLLVACGVSEPILGVRFNNYPYILLYNKLPFFDRLWFPYRELSIVFILLSLGAAYLLWQTAARGDRWRLAVRIGGPLLVLGSLATSWMDCFFPLVSRSGQSPAVYLWMATQGGAIIDLPRGPSQTQIVFQPAHQLPLLGGMGERVSIFFPPGYRRLLKTPFVGALTRATEKPGQDTVILPANKAEFVRLGFRWVILHRELVDTRFNQGSEIPKQELARAPFDITRRITKLLGEPVAVDGPMVVWSLTPVASAPESLLPTPDNLWQRVWERPEPATFETRMYEQGRLGQP